MADKEKSQKNNRERQRRYRDKNESISITYPAGTKERISAQGYTYNAFIKNLVLRELDRLEGKNNEN